MVHVILERVVQKIRSKQNFRPILSHIGQAIPASLHFTSPFYMLIQNTLFKSRLDHPATKALVILFAAYFSIQLKTRFSYIICLKFTGM